MSSPTNNRSNFSYPSRTPPPQGYPATGQGQQAMAQGQQDIMRGQQQTLQGQQGTLQGLKTAAVGIHVRSSLPPPPLLRELSLSLPQHSQAPSLAKSNIVQGAGETLRGTLNSAVDRRFKASPEQIAAHNQVAQAGREEIESGRMSETSRQRERFNNLGSGGQGQPGGGVENTGQPSGPKGILKKMRDPTGNPRIINE